ncbi:MAG: ISAzo13 family transposase [Chlamydiota bacterium]
MKIDQEKLEPLKIKYQQISFCLTERSKRLWGASEALAWGKGGVTAVQKATGISRPTIYVGIKELRVERTLAGEKVRKTGGGAKRLTFKDGSLLTDLDNLVEPTAKGDPESPLRWTCKSVRTLTEELGKNHKVSFRSTGTLLAQLGYSLQLNKKTKEKESSPHRNAQFIHINNKIKCFHGLLLPTISVDTKKKELIGEYKNNGREYCKKGEPTEVNTHDFPDKENGKVAPYGVYDIGKNKGWVSVGVCNDTAEFAVNAIRSWWYEMGEKEYAEASDLLITADCGGSNGYRVKLWKWELQKLADELELTIHVCHFPPGTSKWNKIEHKMFSYISQNWRGKPLITKEAVVQLIAHTKTKKGLEICSKLDERVYDTGKKISKAEMKSINLKKDTLHGDWNYMIRPRKDGVVKSRKV